MSPLSRLPFPGLSPSGVAMQKLSLSPGTDEEAERRPSATGPPSSHPISRPPPAAEDALPNRERGHPPTGHLQRIGGE